MSKEDVQDPMQQITDAMVDVRNEAIVQTANLYLFGRKIVLVGVGMTFLGVDGLQACVRRAVERGEIAEADACKMASDLQQQAAERAKAADRMRVDLTEKATATLLESSNGILRLLRVPELKVVFEQETSRQSNEKPADTDSVAD